MVALLRRLGALRRTYRRNGTDDRRAAGAHGRANRVALVAEVLLRHPFLRRRSRHGADAAQGVFAAAPFPGRPGLRFDALVRRRGATPDPAIGPARSAGPPLQPAVLHRRGDPEGLHRAGRRLLPRGRRGRLAVEKRLLATGGAGRDRPADPRTAHVVLPGGRRCGDALRDGTRHADRQLERKRRIVCRKDGRRDSPQPSFPSHAQQHGPLPQRPLGAAAAGGRPRCDGQRRHQLHAPHRPLHGHAPAARGRTLGLPSDAAEYPLAAFHFAGDATTPPFTLCFEDRDGAEGLHAYYDRQTAQESTLHRITLSLQLAPHEFAALLAPGTGAPDIRSVFLLDTGGETVRATLHAIDTYDPARGSVRCTFTRLPEDQ